MRWAGTSKIEQHLFIITTTLEINCRMPIKWRNSTSKTPSYYVMTKWLTYLIKLVKMQAIKLMRAIKRFSNKDLFLSLSKWLGKKDFQFLNKKMMNYWLFLNLMIFITNQLLKINLMHPLKIPILFLILNIKQKFKMKKN